MTCKQSCWMGLLGKLLTRGTIAAGYPISFVASCLHVGQDYWTPLSRTGRTALKREGTKGEGAENDPGSLMAEEWPCQVDCLSSVPDRLDIGLASSSSTILQVMDARSLCEVRSARIPAYPWCSLLVLFYPLTAPAPHPVLRYKFPSLHGPCLMCSLLPPPIYKPHCSHRPWTELPYYYL